MEKKKKTILVSACLLGAHVNYCGGHKNNLAIRALAEKVILIPICPEQLGGLATPRPAAEITGGTGKDVWRGTARVLTVAGEDRTEAFKRGAREVWLLAGVLGAQAALLKARSPSCGHGEVYDGTFSGVKIDGDGVTAAFLHGQNLPVFSEDELAQCEKWLSTGES